ncbi:MAG: LUD domain-containing protein [Sediminibacterium sp.]|nr:LUD domain-containing protein [Sediminibacterium sp.]
MSSSPKDKILQRIRLAQKSLNQPQSIPEINVDSYLNDWQKELNLCDLFKQNFEQLLGSFFSCTSQNEFNTCLFEIIHKNHWYEIFTPEKKIEFYLNQLNKSTFNITHSLSDCDVSFTTCEYAIARTGTIVLSSALSLGRTSSVFAPNHICILHPDQFLKDETTALNFLSQKYPAGWPSSVSFATGPSRTADIEKTLVVGVHGPKTVGVILLEPNVYETVCK